MGVTIIYKSITYSKSKQKNDIYEQELQNIMQNDLQRNKHNSRVRQAHIHGPPIFLLPTLSHFPRNHLLTHLGHSPFPQPNPPDAPTPSSESHLLQEAFCFCCSPRFSSPCDSPCAFHHRVSHLESSHSWRQWHAGASSEQLARADR